MQFSLIRCSVRLVFIRIKHHWCETKSNTPMQPHDDNPMQRLENVCTIEQAVLSNRFTWESIKRLHHAAKKHCWMNAYDEPCHSNTIQVGVVDLHP